MPDCKNPVLKYREIESLIKAPRLAPGLLDENLLSKLYSTEETTRSPHTKYRGDFEAIDPTPYPKDSIGRLEFAKDLLRKDNPIHALSNRKSDLAPFIW